MAAIARALAALAVLLAGYAVAGRIGGLIPANPGWREARAGVRIYVIDNGIHTDLVVPVAAVGVDWRGLARAEDIADPRYAGHRWLSVGWGDRDFYVNTPSWSRVRPLTVLCAAIGSGASVLHVEHLPEPAAAAGVYPVMLTPAEYRRLAGFVRASFAAPGGRVASQHGYGAHDAFYAARGRYSAVRTCNSWTGEALRHAGVRVGRWTPFPASVTSLLPAR